MTKSLLSYHVVTGEVMNVTLLKDWVPIFAGILTVFVAVLTFLRARKLGGWKAFGLGSVPESDAETTKHLRQLIAEAAPGASPESKQYLLLKEYHSQGIAQSKISFWFSLIFATPRFAVIISGILSFQADRELSKQAW